MAATPERAEKAGSMILTAEKKFDYGKIDIKLDGGKIDTKLLSHYSKKGPKIGYKAIIKQGPEIFRGEVVGFKNKCIVFKTGEKTYVCAKKADFRGQYHRYHL